MECPRKLKKGIKQLKYTNVKQELAFKKILEIAKQDPKLFEMFRQGFKK